MTPPLSIEVLGPLNVLRQGSAVPLPPSKKTRALLAYLALDGRPHRRERLCELLWPGPDDPRGALRWSLSRVRSILGEDADEIVEADRGSVRFRTERLTVDVLETRKRLNGPPELASAESLREAAAAFRGELLEGLDLPDCFGFHAWLVAVREEARGLQASVLRALLAALRSSPAEALPYARALVAASPLDDDGHGAVIRLLGALGRPRDAVAHYESCRRLFAAELNARPSPAVEDARRALGQVAAPAAAPTVPPPAAEKPREAAFVGRHESRARCAERLASARRAEPGPVLLAVGEPGIGKSRLLRELAQMTEAAGGRCLMGRAFEAEIGIPYGVWRSALAPLGDEALPAELRWRPGADAHPSADRQRLFGDVAGLLAGLSADRPLLVALDDLHWCDEASAALLHFVARATRAAGRLVLAGAARAGELPDNPDALRVVRALSREAALERIELGPLDRADALALVRAVDSALDAEALAGDAGGNPLFLIEGARALRGGASLTDTLDGLLAERITRIEGSGRALLPWAAALGHGFGADLLGRVAGLTAPELLAGLEALERRGILQAAGDGYEFAHDLVRQAAYRRISAPRRRVIHAHVAATLRTASEAFGPLAPELVRHASLGGHHELAARACVAAAERCLRLLAPAEAFETTGIGLEHARVLAGAERVRLEVALLRLRVLCAPVGPRRAGLESALESAVGEAGRLGLAAEASAGLFALSVLHQEAGDFARAREDTLRAAETSRKGNSAGAAGQLANTARCLAQIERDIPRARALAAEASALAAAAGAELPELLCAQALLHRWDGRPADARPLLERAAALFRREEDGRRECMCLATLVALELESGSAADAVERSQALRPLAQRLHEAGDDAAVAEALDALASEAAGAAAPGRAEAALAALAAQDSKAPLAHALNLAAQIRLARGEDGAGALAEQALEAAEAVQRRSEMALACAILYSVAMSEDDAARAARWIGPALPYLREPDVLSARALAALRAAAAAAGLDDPTHAHTDVT